MKKTCIHCQCDKPINQFVKSKQYDDGFKNECKECHNAKNRKRYHKHWEKEQARRHKKHMGLKLAALAAYGTNCQCCGESENSFLTIDHMNNDGSARRSEEGIGHNFYQWLKNNKYPDGFQVLCMNCNFSKYTNGGVCIHQENKSYVKN